MEAWIALAGAVFGGAGLKIIEYFINRSKLKIDAASEIREELRDEISNLRKEMRYLEEELDHWKQRYYVLLERFNEIKIKHNITDFPFKEHQRKKE